MRAPRRGPGHGDLARDADVVAGEVEVDLEAAAVRQLDDPQQQERGDGLAAHARGLRFGERLGEHAIVLRRIPLLVGGDRVRDDDALPGAEGVLRAHDRGDLVRAIDRPVELERALAQPEAGNTRVP